MFKKKTVAIISAVILLCMVLTFTACGEISSVHQLTDLYSSGVLTKDNVKNIAALREGEVRIVDSEEQLESDYRKIEFEPTTPQPLTDETKRLIENDFKATIGEKIDRFSITGYYGNYNGYYVVDIEYMLEGQDYINDVVYDIIVADVFLGYVHGHFKLYAWKAS